MNNSALTYEVVIVGGGPVGLFLGLCLEQAGLTCRILEKRSSPSADSRSLGIHPPSLELFESLELADKLIREGIKITAGHAFANSQKIGSLSFGDCPKPYNFILALPQSRTEQILEKALQKYNPNVLERDAEVVQINLQTDHHLVTYRKGEKKTNITADYIIGCDGSRSFVRQQAGISFCGESYPDTYVMGDFTDNTDFGCDAAVFLCDEGLVESFPLPEKRRRWVVKTSQYCSKNRRESIEKAVRRRIGHSLSDVDHFMLSSFGVKKRTARSMVKDHIILCGDAAHVISPIGGQGMNLGWLGARDLAQSLHKVITGGIPAQKILPAFEKRRKKAARNAIRRSELNMKLGRKANYPVLRNGIISLMLNTPLSKIMARLFTMRYIEEGFF